jgi:acetyl-CoA acetyltransferase
MAYQDRDAVIVGAVRTPVGKGKASGALHGVLPADLLAHSLRELVARTGVDPSTSLVIRYLARASRSRFRARPSTASAAAASRRSASRPKACLPARTTSWWLRVWNP